MLSDYLYRNRTALSLVFCVLFSLGSMIWKSNGFSQFLVSIRGAGSGISSSLSDLGDWFSGLWRSLEDYQNVVAERDVLAQMLKENDVLYARYVQLKKENARLRKDLGFKMEIDYPQVKAEVLAVRLSAIYKTVIIDKGSDDGIEPFMPVVAKAIYKGIDPESGEEKRYFVHALVGKTISVESGSSIIQPLVNSRFRCGVRVPGTRLWATLDGNSDRSMLPKLQYISSFVTLDADKKNLPVVTSGKGGVFPPGILVGRIVDSHEGGDGIRLSKQGFKTAYLEPFAQIETLDSVTVIKKRPYQWAENWPENAQIIPEVPVMGKSLQPAMNSSELPGTQKFLANVPKVLVAKEEKKQKLQAKLKKKKTPPKKKPKPKTVNPSSETEEDAEFEEEIQTIEEVDSIDGDIIDGTGGP